MNSALLYKVFFVGTIVLVLIVLLTEYANYRRHRIIQNISSLVGEHIVKMRSTEKVGGPMPHAMLYSAMNQIIDADSDEDALTSMKTMIGIVAESKRRSFQLPLVHKNVAKIVSQWAERTSSKSSPVASKLLVHIFERQIQHMDQLTAQAMVTISDTDEELAYIQMRSLSHHVDGAVTSGIVVDPKLILLSPNTTTIEKWLNCNNSRMKTAAELLLKNIQEAREEHQRSLSVST